MYTLRLYHDAYSPGSRTEQDLEAQHGIAYVLTGSAKIGDTSLHADSAIYWRDTTTIEAGPEGAVIWRWELVRTEAPNNIAKGAGIDSHLRMSRRIRMFELAPRSKWLFRLDCIYNNRGSTGLHSHPGSGIRCLLKGHLRVESDKGECSDNRKTGDCWYEEGSYPLVSTSDPGETADFLRGMILPPEYLHYPDTAVWIEGKKMCESEWKLYVQEVVTLI
ncbi:MAG: hypothetical protein N3B14_08625 [Thermoleophilia bacterium]|nr:hypothetical protein [Thermoleophilia bacterium]